MIDLELREKVARLMHKPVDDASMFYIDGDGVHRMRAQGWGNRPTPAYEANVADAWEVVEFMREKKKRRLRLYQRDRGDWFAEFVPIELGRAYRPGCVASTAPLAICMAFVAAMENNHES